MAVCEACWNTAYRIARMTGRHQAEVYQELIKANPSDGTHNGLNDEKPPPTEVGGLITGVASAARWYTRAMGKRETQLPLIAVILVAVAGLIFWRRNRDNSA